MNRNTVEKLAVAAIETQICLCNLLEPFINKNDKEPCWDGFINIYQNEKKVKEPAVNRVPVQVKGTEQKDFSKKVIAVQINLTDLRSYLNVHGTLYFVVYVNGKKSKIYYVDLTPVRIKEILSRASDQQKTIKVELRELPENIKDIESIVINFADHCSKQASFSNIQLTTLEELSKSDKLPHFSLYYSGHGVEDPIGAMLKYDAPYIYLVSDSLPIPQPLASIPKDIVFTETMPASIKVAGIEFYNSYERTRSKDGLSIRIGESFTIKVDPNKNTSTIYKGSNKLRVLKHDLEFMIAFIENSGFSINDSNFEFVPHDEELAKFNLHQQKEDLAFYQKAVRTLNELNCTGDIDLSTLPKGHFWNLKYLITAIVDKKPVKGLLSNLPLVGNLHIGDYVFALVFEPLEKEEGIYIVRDFFKTEMKVHNVDENEQWHRVSQYVILTCDNILTLSNFRTDAILPSFKSLPPSPFLYGQANLLLLEVLSAYDMAENRKDLLELALEMAEWLMSEASEEILSQEVRMLNLYQTIIRIRALNEKEKSEIIGIIANSENRPDLLFAANLLLDRQLDAKSAFLKMGEVEQETFSKYPIYNLLKDKG